MKSCSSLVVLIQFALIIHHGVKFVTAAPMDLESDLENEIPTGKSDEGKLFRETYALRMKSYMNASVDPCGDFYDYACGNFSNVIEDLEVTRKRSNLLDIFYILTDLVDKTLQRTRDPEEEYYEELQKAKQFLDSCVNAKLWPIEPSEEYLKVVKEIGGFPAVDLSWNASTFDWFKMTAYFTRYGIEGLVKENIYQMYPFSPYYELPKFGFEFDVYLENIENNQSAGYVYSEKVMNDLLEIYGVTGAKAEKVIQGVIGFWRDALLADKIMNDYGGCEKASLKDDSYASEFPRWNEFFAIAWESKEFRLTEFSECPCKSYYNKLNQVIAKQPEAVANYLALKFLFTMHPQLQSVKFQRLHCVIRTKDGMPLVLSHFYLKEHYNKKIEADIFEIVAEIKNSLRDLVNTADWLDEPTRLEALNKLRNLRAYVGEVPDPIISTFIKEMRRLNFSDNFAANNLQLAKFEVDMHHYGYLHQDFDENSLPTDMLDVIQVNAFHYSVKNSINIMAGVLHPPVYHPSLPKSVKYGTMGYIIGHELTHSFGGSGSYFDSNLTQRDWWSEKSSKVLKERSNCFTEHYGKFSVPGLTKKINGKKSLDENIADNSGVREALAAYRKVFKAAAEDKEDDFIRKESLPGLDLTPEQTFFLSFAQVYCSKYTPKHLWVELSDDHPLDKYRVLGSLQNFEEFSLVYNCPLGASMNPNEKCRLW